MKKHLSTLFSLVLFSCAVVSCSSDENSLIPADDTLARINRDISNNIYYLAENNSCGSASNSLPQFVEFSKGLLDHTNTSRESAITYQDYKASAIAFYAREGYTSAQLSPAIDNSLGTIQRYQGDYVRMLNDFVSQGKISSQARDIIIQYVNLYSTSQDYNTFVAQTNTYVYNVNSSTLSTRDKNVLLTVFSGLSGNRDLFENGEEYEFNEISQYARRGPSLSTICAGNMIVGMVGGSIGGPPGFVAGFIGGLWSCYTAGCFD